MYRRKKSNGEELSHAAQILGRKGGRARLTKMTPEERKRIAALGGAGGKGKKKPRKDKQHEQTKKE